jgi:pimeloyl-ACP methyl ester carboxylesterase
MRCVRVPVLIGYATLAFVALPTTPSAQGALALRPCRHEAGFLCGTLTVPLDRAGRLPGHIGLRVAVARVRPPSGRVLIALSGGPGQSSVTAAPSFAASLSPALGRYRLVVLDQRGTGASGALDCPALQPLGELEEIPPADIARCAQRLGPRRAFYSTTDSVLDLDDLRAALGVPRVAIMGVSYGTFVAQQYARRFPSRVERLVLDSVIGPDGVDPYLLDSYGGLRRVLREQCAHAACRGVTPDPVADVATLVARLERAPLRGSAYDRLGRRRRVSLADPAALFNLFVAADLNPFLQPALPGAIRSAVRGDVAPLLRLRRIGDGPPTKLRDLSVALNVATGCEDTRLPYALTTPFDERPGLAQQGIDSVPASGLAPFDAATALSTSYAQDCLLWPPDPVDPPSEDPLPDVPALILDGRLDLRTPLENGRALAALLPRAQVVTVPGTGHDELDSDITGCADRALARFAAGRAVGHPCAGLTNEVPPFPRAPASLRDYRSAPGVGGRRGRIVFAVLDSAVDARVAVLQTLFAGFSGPARGGGLRGGRFAGGSGGAIVLHRYEYVPGVRLTGTLHTRAGQATGTVRVTVPGRDDGTLTLLADGQATGVLGGRAVASRMPRRRARAAYADAPSSREPARLPRVAVKMSADNRWTAAH